MADQPSKESLERAIKFKVHSDCYWDNACSRCIGLALEFDAIAKEGESKLSIGVELWTKACRKAEDDIKALRQQNAALVSALRDALDKCRSSMSIAQREDQGVNWLAWRNQLNASIYRQAAALAPYAPAEEKEKP